MLIRGPVREVFQAFIQRLRPISGLRNQADDWGSARPSAGNGKCINASTDVLVKEVIPDKKISIEWGDPATTVDYEFTAHKDDTTYVVIKNYGFSQKGDELVQTIKDSTGGFTTVLDGLKAYLEHGLKLNLIMDKFPDLG